VEGREGEIHVPRAVHVERGGRDHCQHRGDDGEEAPRPEIAEHRAHGHAEAGGPLGAAVFLGDPPEPRRIVGGLQEHEAERHADEPPRRQEREAHPGHRHLLEKPAVPGRRGGERCDRGAREEQGAAEQQQDHGGQGGDGAAAEQDDPQGQRDHVVRVREDRAGGPRAERGLERDPDEWGREHEEAAERARRGGAEAGRDERQRETDQHFEAREREAGRIEALDEATAEERQQAPGEHPEEGAAERASDHQVTSVAGDVRDAQERWPEDVQKARRPRRQREQDDDPHGGLRSHPAVSPRDQRTDQGQPRDGQKQGTPRGIEGREGRVDDPVRRIHFDCT
jgi:hypothetical protein